MRMKLLQMGMYPDPARPLTAMMEVAVETVSTVAQIAMETVEKMSAVTMEQLKTAAQQEGHHRCSTIRDQLLLINLAKPSNMTCASNYLQQTPCAWNDRAHTGCKALRIWRWWSIRLQVTPAGGQKQVQGFWIT